MPKPRRPPPAPSAEAGGADAAQRRARERLCVATGTALGEDQLVRFALAPDGTITPDVAAKLPGRGVWVSARRTAIDEARRRGAFARSLKAPAKVPEDLADLTEALLSRRCLEHLGLMRRAGALAMGATAVEAAIRARPVWALVEACDGSADGREKLQNLHFGLWGRPAPVAGCFTGAELGMALGRARVIHACLLQERLARQWAVEIGRLAGFRAIVPGSWPDSWRPVGMGLGGAGG